MKRYINCIILQDAFGEISYATIGKNKVIIVNNYKIFESIDSETARDIHLICMKYDIEDYTINENESIDVDFVDLSAKRLKKLPLKFNRISKHFLCCDNNLTSLEGSPEYVSGFFSCWGNKLTTLEGCPKYIGLFFQCQFNNLTSLEGYPEYIGGNFKCEENPIYNIVKYFILREDKDNLVELFNYYDIVQGMSVIYDRLKFFYEGIDIKLTDKMLEDIKNVGYKIVY